MVCCLAVNPHMAKPNSPFRLTPLRVYLISIQGGGGGHAPRTPYKDRQEATTIVIDAWLLNLIGEEALPTAHAYYIDVVILTPKRWAQLTYGQLPILFGRIAHPVRNHWGLTAMQTLFICSLNLESRREQWTYGTPSQAFINSASTFFISQWLTHCRRNL